MYRFDDKWRKRLLEDALVSDLLEGAKSPTASAHRGGAAETAPVSTVAEAPPSHVRMAKA
jgi:hypothetical protein